MFISVSGMVGAGKTTVARQIVASLGKAGIRARSHRFQSLPCFRLLRGSLRPDVPRTGTSGRTGSQANQMRRSAYRRRPLTISRLLIYCTRMLAFRIYLLGRPSGEWWVFNRYFYDNFVHLTLTTRREQIYYGLLRRMVPVPAVSVLVVADPDVIRARRPSYSTTYLTDVPDGYRRVVDDFPMLVTIRTDATEATSCEEAVEALVAARVAKSTPTSGECGA